MNNLEFVDIAKRIESTLKTKYRLGGWGQREGSTYLFDCVCLIKSILWGFKFEKDGHGGAIYASNGVPDIDADTMIKVCNDVSTDFSNIEIGEVVWMNGHIGIYVGNRQVVEATAAWERKVLISGIENNGQRSRNGLYTSNWLKHGKLPYIEYVSECDLRYKSHIQDIGWTDWVDAGKVSGTEGQCKRIEAIIIDLIKGKKCRYRVHMENIGWGEWVNNGEVAGTTGECRKIEAIEIETDVELEVQEHVQDIGWLPVSKGTHIKIGTEGKNLRLEAFKIKVM